MNIFKILREKKMNELCDECYHKMSKYSKLGNNWEFASKLDIKNVDNEVLSILQTFPHVAEQKCKAGIPLILFCVECGLINCVKWYIETSDNLNIEDGNTENIALYAYKFNIPELVNICAKNSILSSWENKNGISLKYLLKRDERKKEMKNHLEKNKHLIY